MNLSLSKQLNQMSAKETSLRTKVWYWKRAARKQTKHQTAFKKKTLGTDVQYLENEIIKLQEKHEKKSNEKMKMVNTMKIFEWCKRTFFQWA